MRKNVAGNFRGNHCTNYHLKRVVESNFLHFGMKTKKPTLASARKSII